MGPDEPAGETKKPASIGWRAESLSFDPRTAVPRPLPYRRNNRRNHSVHYTLALRFQPHRFGPSTKPHSSLTPYPITLYSHWASGITTHLSKLHQVCPQYLGLINPLLRQDDSEAHVRVEFLINRQLSPPHRSYQSSSGCHARTPADSDKAHPPGQSR